MTSMRQLFERALGVAFGAACVFMLLVTAGNGVRSWLLLRPVPPLEVGQAAPTVALPMADEPGFIIDTARLGGRPLLFTLWQEGCADCADSLRLANRYQEEFGDRGLLALVIAEGDYLAVHRSSTFARQHAPAALRAEDVLGTVRRQFGAGEAARWILVGASGRVVGFGASVGPSREMVAASVAL